VSSATWIRERSDPRRLHLASEIRIRATGRKFNSALLHQTTTLKLKLRAFIPATAATI
jgi:hypothetical protein